MNPKYKLVPQISTRSRRGSIDKTLLPTEYKYKHVWQNARLKLKFRLIINSIIKAATSGDREEKQKFRIIGSTPLFDPSIQEKGPFLILYPENILLRYWNVFISLTMLYTSIFMPYFLAFPPLSSIDVVDYMDKILTCAYFLDFLINLFTAYYDKNGRLVTSITKIFRSYLHSSMLIDLISFFPFDVVFETKKNVPVVCKLAKILRISRMSELVKVTNRYQLILKIQDLFSIRHLTMQIWIRFIIIGLCMHIATCLWCLAASVEDFGIDSWVFRSGLIDDKDDVTLYISGLYWAVTTFSTVGYGDIDAGTDGERLLSVFWMVLSTVLLGIVIGTLINFFSKLDTFEKMMKNKLLVIDDFADEYELSKSLRIKLRYAVEQSSEIAGYNLLQNSEIFSELPKSLRFEVALGMHRGAAKHLKFFHNKDDAVITGIIPFLLPSFITKDNFVYTSFSHADLIYFIVKGKVLYLTHSNLSIYTTKKKDHFGDIEFFFKVPRKFSAVCCENTEILLLTREIVCKMKKNYPLAWFELKTVAKEREKVMQKNVERVEKLKVFASIHSKSEVHVKWFRMVNKIKRDMKRTRHVELKRMKRKVCEFDVCEVIDRMNRKLQRIRESVKIMKRCERVV